MAEQQQQAETTAQGQQAPEQAAAEQKPEGQIQAVRRSGGISRVRERAFHSLFSPFFESPLFGSPFRRGALGLARKMIDDVDRMMEEVASPAFWRWPEATWPTWSPRIEEFQRGDEFVVRADLPGLSKDDIRVTVDDGVLTIEGERREESERREAGMYRSEVRYGSFRRSIALPEDADLDSVNARFENGVLEVTTKLPSGTHPEPRRIEIQSGSAAASETEVKPESESVH